MRTYIKKTLKKLANMQQFSCISGHRRYLVSIGYLPTTSIGTVMVFGGMHAFWSQAW
jgi:hypothetical protein